MSRVVVVDENDEILGYKDRADRSDDIIRISVLWLINPKKEVLIAQRALTKKHSPGLWGISVAGTVEEGETYASNIIKEAQEEIGIVITEDKLIVGPKVLVNDEHRYFAQVYFYESDTTAESFAIQKDEVEQVRWISVPDLEQWFKEKPEDFPAAFTYARNDIQSFLQKE